MNLSDLFLKKEEKVQPTLVGIVLSKADDTKLYTDALANQDLVVDRVVTKDDQTVLMVSKSELDSMEDVTAYKVNDEAAVLVVGVEKGLMTFPDTMDFDENISKSAFFPSYRLATDVLGDTLGNIVFSEGDMEVTKTAVKKALGDFESYVSGVIDSMPVSAFKAEEAVVATQKGMLINEGGQDEADKDKEDTKKEEETGDEATDDNADAGTGDEATGDADADADAGGDTEAGDADVQKDEADSGVAKQLEGLVTAMSALTTNVSALKSDIAGVKNDFTSQVDELKSSIKKTDEAITGTVHSDVSEDDSSVNTNVKKSGGDSHVWDSALDFGEGVEVS